MSEPNPSPYDDVPYEGTTYRETHPDVLATVGRLHGLTPPSVDNCRVLEVGCAEGTNLVPIALSLPRATFLGIDLSSRQVETARTLARELGARNVRFEALNLDAVEEASGPFDYIIAHGIYSWIPEDSRRKLLEMVGRNLVRGGVGYVSFNARPGWNFRGVLRDLMLYHTAGIADPRERARQARAVIESLLGMMPDATSPYTGLLRTEGLQVAKHRDGYLLHDHLEEVNDPCYFQEFLEQATAHGLQYVGDALHYTMVAEQAEPVQSALRQLSPDPLRQEQYFDFITNRSFRRSLWCHEGLPVRFEIAPKAINGLRVAAPLALAGSAPHATVGTTETFQGSRGGPYHTDDLLNRCLLASLIESRPRSLAFDELRAAMESRLVQMAGPSAGPPSVDDDGLAKRVLEHYHAGRIELRTSDPDCCDRPGPNPAAAPYARRQAESGRSVTNLRHETVTLSEFERLVVRRLDGKTDRSALLDSLEKAIIAGEFQLIQEGRPLREPNQIRPVLMRSVEPCLLRLAASALLV